MDINTLRGVLIIFFIIVFCGVVLWAWSARRKSDFEEAANLPFADEEQDHQTVKRGD